MTEVEAVEAAEDTMEEAAVEMEEMEITQVVAEAAVALATSEVEPRLLIFKELMVT